METEKQKKQSLRKSRISLGALVELENALRDYLREVEEAEHAREGIARGTVKTYTDGPKKFVAWVGYAFALAPSTKGQMPAKPEIASLRIERPAARKSRISLSALAEVDAAFEEFVRAVLQAEMGARATNQLCDHSDYFVRWLKYEFVPGARKLWRGQRRTDAAGELAIEIPIKKKPVAPSVR